MKKSSGRVILQILSAVLGSVLFCVSVFLIILGEGITAVVMAIAAAVYLTARVLAAANEKDKNGPLNIFAVVFIVLFLLLCLVAVDKLSPSEKEEETGVSSHQVVAGEKVVSGTSEDVLRAEEVSSGLVEGSAEYSDVQADSEIKVTLSTAEETPSDSASTLSGGLKDDIFSSDRVNEVVLIETEESDEALETAESVVSSEIEEIVESLEAAESVVSSEIEESIDLIEKEEIAEQSETEVTSAALEIEEVSGETGKDKEPESSVRIPASPTFVSSEVTVSVPSAPTFVSGEVSQVVPLSPEAVAVTSALVPSSPEDIGVTSALVPSAPEDVGVASALVPSAPEAITVSALIVPSSPAVTTVSQAVVPSAPEFTEPKAILVELDVPVPVQKEEEEYDPWADFFFSDEDLTLDDGIYYFTLYVNDFEEGDVEVLVENGEVYISASELSYYIYSYLEDESAERIFGGEYDYYSIEYLEYVGIEAWADTNFFEYYVTISSTDMPVTRISIKGNSNSNVVRPISGAVTIDPVNYYVISSYSLNASTSGKTGKNFLDNLRLSLSSNNSFRFFDIYGQFSWSLSGSFDAAQFSWGSYSFYKDLDDLSIRLRFGNVSPDSFSPSGTSIGIRFDKTGSSSSSSRDDEVLIVLEKDSDVVVYNQEREIYRKSLTAGRYILQDFILYSGSNNIRIVITPLDGSESTEETFTISYSTSLLEKGEIYYGAGYAFSRTVVDNTTERESIQVDIPWINSKVLRYDLRDFAVSGYLKIGLSDVLTGNFQLALKGKGASFSYKASTELSSINSLGSLHFNANFTYSGTASLYLRLSQQFSLSGKGFIRGLSMAVSYSRADFSSNGVDIITPTVSLSGSFGIFGWSVGASATVLPSSIETTTWVVSPSLTFSLGKLSFSFSSSMSGIGSGNVTYSGRVSASFRIKTVSTTVSSSGSDTSISSSYSGEKFGISAHVRTSDFTNLKSYSYSADISSSTSLFSYSASLSTSGSFENISLSGNMGFASVFADGLMSFSSSVPSSFMLIKQSGALKGNTVSIALSSSSDSTVPSGYVGAVLYKGLPSSGAANISVYSESGDGFSSAKAFDIFIADTDKRGYVVTLEGEASYTVAGTAEVGDYIWTNGSSPLYKVEIDDYGYISLEATDDYVFSDRKGVFILSDLSKGTYGFDVKSGNSWYLILVSVTNENSASLVAMLEGYENTELTPPDVYEGVIEMKIKRQISSEVFWFELYGEAQ